MEFSKLIQSYYKLSPYEKGAFHLATNLIPKSKCKISKNSALMEKFSVEYFYKKLVETHDERVRKRMLRRKNL